MDDYIEDEPYSKDNKLNRKINDEIDEVPIDDSNLQKYACKHGVVGFCGICSDEDNEGLVNLDFLDEEQLKEGEIKKPTSKEALKTLNEKEKELKEKLMKVIIKSKASNKEVIRVLAFLINSFKKIK